MNNPENCQYIIPDGPGVYRQCKNPRPQNHNLPPYCYIRTHNTQEVIDFMSKQMIYVVEPSPETPLKYNFKLQKYSRKLTKQEKIEARAAKNLCKDKKGTYTGYKRHKTRGQVHPACLECRLAAATYNRMWRIKHKVSNSKRRNKNKWQKVGLDIPQRGDKCQCGSGCSEPAGKKLVLDHIIPQKYGGKNVPGNGQALCALCNGNKGEGWSCSLHGTEWPEAKKAIESWYNTSALKRKFAEVLH